MTDKQEFANIQHNLLASIAAPYLKTLHILDSQNDSSSIKQKGDIWSKITEDYKTKCPTEPLSTATIQKYYNFIKEKEKDFTKQDEDLLLKITAEYKHIIDNKNKKLDVKSRQAKEIAWAEITIQFNAQCLKDNLHTKKYLTQYYESRLIQSNMNNTSANYEDMHMKTEEVLLKEEMLPEMVADVIKAEMENSIPEEDTEVENILIMSVKQEMIEEEGSEEAADPLMEVNVKQEFNHEEETAVDHIHMNIRNQNIASPEDDNQYEDEEGEESGTSEEVNNRPAKRSHETAFGPMTLLYSSSDSSTSSSEDDSDELNRFVGYEAKLKFLQDKIEMNRQHQLKKLQLEEQKLLLNLEMQENRLRQFKEENDLRLKLLELDVEITKKQLELTRKTIKHK